MRQNFLKETEIPYDRLCILHKGHLMDQRTKFKNTLERYIHYRGIDIVLHLKDGKVIELDKNRQMENDTVIGNLSEGIVRIPIADIKSADFFAA